MMMKENSSGETDLSMVDKQVSGFSIKDEYSHKIHVLEPEKPDIDVSGGISKLFSMITKDMALANIGDEYMKYCKEQFWLMSLLYHHGDYIHFRRYKQR